MSILVQRIYGFLFGPVLASFKELQSRADELNTMLQDTRNRVTDIAQRIDNTAAEVTAVAGDVRILARHADAFNASLESSKERVDEIVGRLDAVALHASEIDQRSRDLVGRADQNSAEVAQLRSRLLATPYMSQPLASWNPSVRSTPGNFDYVGFEDIFRGPEPLIRERQAVYLPLLRDHAPVVDVGSGRGEFLELLGEAGIEALGIDTNAQMVEHCRAGGRSNVRCVDVLTYLESVPSDTVGAIFSAQVTEHLTPDDLLAFVSASLSRLRPGGLFIAETVNPNSIEGLKTFYVDLTHVKPLFPETFAFLCRSAGFSSVRIFYPNGGGFDEPEPTSQHEYAVVAAR